MVLPFIFGAVAIGAGIAGIKKGIDAASDNSIAEQLQKDARSIYESAEKDLKHARSTTTESLEKLGRLKLDTWNRQLGRFVDLYEQLKNVEINGQANVGELNAARFTRQELGQMKDLSLKAQEVMIGGAGALGTGALVGVATYGGAMMFATASTGTAIGSLAGAAATNATLAWFGGGALAAGGMGMAGGMAVLGGIVAGPVLAVGGMMLASKAREKLANAKRYQAEANKEVEEMNNAICVLEAIQDVTLKFDEIVRQLSRAMVPVLNNLGKAIATSGVDYSKYDASQKHQVYIAVQLAQVTHLVLETPLLTEEGAIDDRCFGALQSAEKALLPQR
jgi:membrane protein implicated in regulation of membrane protease activity